MIGITNLKLLIIICGFLFILFILISIILGSYISYYVLKWLKRNINNRLYYDSYKSGSTRILKKYGDLPVKRAYLVRSNINSFLSVLFDVITWRSYSSQLQKYRENTNDHSFFPNHTSMMVEVELENKTRKMIVIEKTNGVKVTLNFQKYELQEMLKINLKKDKIFTINELLDNTKERIGTKHFFNWNLYNNNCQQFISEILISMGKTNSKYNEFNSQQIPLEAIKFSDPVMYILNIITNITSSVESIYFDITDILTQN